ncbi:MAG: hypothetical protein AB1611_12150 [bacterium]
MMMILASPSLSQGTGLGMADSTMKKMTARLDSRERNTVRLIFFRLL